MEECKTCLNTLPCTCPNTKCPRHGRCCECVAHHRAMGKTPNCYRNPLPGEQPVEG